MTSVAFEKASDTADAQYLRALAFSVAFVRVHSPCLTETLADTIVSKYGSGVWRRVTSDAIGALLWRDEASGVLSLSRDARTDLCVVESADACRTATRLLQAHAAVGVSISATDGHIDVSVPLWDCGACVFRFDAEQHREALAAMFAADSIIKVSRDFGHDAPLLSASLRMPVSEMQSVFDTKTAFV